MPKPPHQLTDTPERGAAPKPRVRRIGHNYPPKVRREMLQRLLSVLGKQNRTGHT